MKNRLLFVALLIATSCRTKKSSEEPPSPPVYEVPGFELLHALIGIWEGPVVSTTMIGDFPTWKVDFRPIAPSQISARNELDSANNIHLSFFVAQYEGRPTLCLRNGGFFSGMERLTYLFLDSVAQDYYRFVEPISRGGRAYVEVRLTHPDSLIFTAYTNKLRTRPTPVLHMRWTAGRLDTTAGMEAARRVGFPQKVPMRDLSTAFAGREETIFYSPIQGDPYPSSQQPYLGTLQATYRHGSAYSPQADKYVVLFTTTRPLIENMQYKPENLRYITRYVRIPATRNGFTFQHIHPGQYFLYALYDANGDGIPSSGDWFSLMGSEVSISPESSASGEAVIDFQLP